MLKICVLWNNRDYLEELNTNTGKHELQQRGDDDDIPNGADGNKHTLNHMLWMQTKLSIKINAQHIIALYENCLYVCSFYEWDRKTHFEALGSVDCSQGPQHSQHSENLHYINGTWPVNHSTVWHHQSEQLITDHVTNNTRQMPTDYK